MNSPILCDYVHCQNEWNGLSINGEAADFGVDQYKSSDGSLHFCSGHFEEMLSDYISFKLEEKEIPQYAFELMRKHNKIERIKNRDRYTSSKLANCAVFRMRFQSKLKDCCAGVGHMLWIAKMRYLATLLNMRR
jgi:hypothetical protein